MLEPKLNKYLSKILMATTYFCTFSLGAVINVITEYDFCPELIVTTILLVFSLCGSFVLLKRLSKEDDGKSLENKPFTTPSALDYLKLDIKTELDRVEFGNKTGEDNSYQYILISIEEAKSVAKKDKSLSDEDFIRIEELLEDDSVTLSDAYSNIFDYLCSIENLTE